MQVAVFCFFVLFIIEHNIVTVIGKTGKRWLTQDSEGEQKVLGQLGPDFGTFGLRPGLDGLQVTLMHPHLNLFRHAVGTVSEGGKWGGGEKKTTGLQSVIAVPLYMVAMLWPHHQRDSKNQLWKCSSKIGASENCDSLGKQQLATQALQSSCHSTQFTVTIVPSRW